MKFLPAVCLFLLFALPVSAAETVSTPFFTAPLPDGWSVLEKTEKAGVYITVLSTQKQDPLVTLIVSSATGCDLKMIADVFAEQYGAKRPPVIGKNGQASFSFRNVSGIDSTAFVAVQDSAYMVTTVTGDLSVARRFLRGLSSENYKGILPQ